MKKLTNQKLSLGKETLAMFAIEESNVKGGTSVGPVVIFTIILSAVDRCDDGSNRRGGCAPH